MQADSPKKEDKTLHSHFFSSLCELLQLFWGSMCHTNTHTAANKLQCHGEKAREKMMVSWKGIPGKTSWIGLFSWGEFHGITGPSWTLCQNQLPFRCHSSSQCWFSLGCTDLSQRSYKEVPKNSQQKHNPDCTIKLQNFLSKPFSPVYSC